MKKGIIMLCLCFFPFVFIYSQSAPDSDCIAKLENIFNVLALKNKYECAKYFNIESKNEHSYIHTMPKEMWDCYLALIKNFPRKDSMHGVNFEETVNVEKSFKEIRDSLSWVRSAPVKRISEEELNSYLKQMGTPEEAFKEYRDLIQKIKSEKEIYLECIDAVLAKNDSLEYANMIPFYAFPPPYSSFISFITELDFLRVFEEFIFNKNEDVLPDVPRAYAYLKS